VTASLFRPPLLDGGETERPLTSTKLQPTALRAAHVASRIHLRRPSRVKVKRKTNPLNHVTEAERESNSPSSGRSNAFPIHAILAEGSGASARQGEHRWIIDPLDGTTNFAHGFAQFCVSIAYEHRRRLELAVVYDALKRELFVAASGSTDGRSTTKPAGPREQSCIELVLEGGATLPGCLRNPCVKAATRRSGPYSRQASGRRLPKPTLQLWPER